jgi:hypothetical protein
VSAYGRDLAVAVQEGGRNLPSLARLLSHGEMMAQA